MSHTTPSAPAERTGFFQTARSSRGARGFMIAAILLLAATAIAALAGVRWNSTRSIPLGFYRMHHPATLHAGDIVMFCAPEAIGALAVQRGYTISGHCPGRAAHMAKPILGLAGDTITHTRRAVYLNGREVPGSLTYAEDTRKRPLPNAAFGDLVLQDGQVWLHSTYHPKALDSRYIGTIHRDHVVAVLRPLLTW